MVLIALGCLFAMVPRLVALVAGSILIGIAYGLPNPAASHLLVRHTSAARRNLIFSIKQTGVPLGGMAAGLVGPPVALAFGWMAALLVVAIAALALAAITQAGRSEWDNDRVPAAPLFRLPRQGLRALWRNPVLPWLAWSSFCFSAVQLCLMSFLTVLLVEEQKLNLVTAGTVLATTQAAGAAGRILWGAVADRVGDGLAVLLGLASFMVIWSAAVTLLAPGTPLLLTGAVFVLLGLTAVGWNGVFLAEVAKLAPPSEVGAFTGGAMFITYIGVMVGPTAMSVVHDRVGSYRASYWMMAGLAALGGVLILSARRRLARIRAGENA
jgi:sugar phosphate permease